MPPENEKKDTSVKEAIANTETSTTTTPQEPATSTPAAAAAPAQTPPVEVLDDEDVELRAAEAALAKETNEGTPGSTTAAADAATGTPASTAAAAPGTPASTAGAPKGEVRMVPAAALVAERKARQQAEARANFSAGQASALAAMTRAGGQPGTQGQPAGEPEVTPEQRLEQIKQEKVELAKKFDAGSISGADWEAQRSTLEDEAYGLRDSMRQPAQAQHQPEDLTLAERTAAIEAANPVVKALSEDEVDHLVGLAYQQAAREGKPIVANAAGTLELRNRVAKLATRLYGQPAPAAAASNTSTTPGAAKPALSDAAQARASKLDLAAGHPPDVSQMGSASTGAGASDAEVEARLAAATTEEEADAIMRGAPQVVNKAMGRLAP